MALPISPERRSRKRGETRRDQGSKAVQSSFLVRVNVLHRLVSWRNAACECRTWLWLFGRPCQVEAKRKVQARLSRLRRCSCLCALRADALLCWMPRRTRRFARLSFDPCLLARAVPLITLVRGANLPALLTRQVCDIKHQLEARDSVPADIQFLRFGRHVVSRACCSERQENLVCYSRYIAV